MATESDRLKQEPEKAWLLALRCLLIGVLVGFIVGFILGGWWICGGIR